MNISMFKRYAGAAMAAMTLLALPFAAAGQECAEAQSQNSAQSDNFGGGDGTEACPYIIADTTHLRVMATRVNLSSTSVQYSGAEDGSAPVYYRLVNNLDLGDYNWTPIGNNPQTFMGVFDGNGKTISNLTISNDKYRQGLFGQIRSGVVRNLGLENVSVVSSYKNGTLGGIVAEMSGVNADNPGVIENCYVTGMVQTTSTSGRVGGIAGQLSNNCIVRNSWSSATVAGYEDVGGIVGNIFLNTSKVENCAALSDAILRIGGTNTDFGRVAGYVPAATSITNNIAYTNMIVMGTLITNGTGNNRNGADRTHEQLQTATGFPSVFTSGTVEDPDNPWCYVPGKLPGFAVDDQPCVGVDMPLYLGLDYAGVAVALPRVILASYSATLVQVGTVEAALIHAQSIVDAIDLGGSGITATVASVASQPFTAAVAGTLASPTGRNGTYRFTVTISDNNLELTSDQLTMTIIATPYIPFTGDGTEVTPYVIADATGLRVMAALVNNADHNAAFGGAGVHYKLEAALDLGGYANWTPIGNWTSTFRGVFDGNGKTISNLTITSGYGGLFGRIVSGTIRNLGLENVSIVSDEAFAGGITYNIEGSSSSVRGIIENCYVTGTIRSNAYSSIVGGIAGYLNDNSTIKNCWSSATITVGEPNGVGGISGGNGRYNRIVENCAALNNAIVRTRGTGATVGRIVGEESNQHMLLSGNIAFDGMIVPTNNFTLSEGAAYKDGVSKSAAELNTVTGFPSVFTSAPWCYVPGKLPGVAVDGQPCVGVDMPDHLKPLAITTQTLPSGVFGTQYSATLNASLGSGFTSSDPITLSVVSGALPTGLTFGASTGIISGTPSAAGTFTFVVKAANEIGDHSKEFTIVIDKATPQYTAPTGLTATYGQTLADVPLNDGWSWVSAMTTSVGNIGARTHKATFTPSNTNNYNVVTNVDVTITVAKANQEPLVITAVSGKRVGDAPFQLAVTGGTGDGKVTYERISGTAATVSATGLVTIGTAAGDIVVRAKKSGGANYNDVTSENITIGIGTVSILSNDRIIPVTPDEGAAVIAPVNVSAFEVTVGPNPVRKTDGVVNVFLSGKHIDNGTLTVFDATGNVVRKIDIRDNVALGKSGSRIIGSWDLRDAKGLAVSEGAYLLRGSVKTVDGKRERVSVIVGVR